MKEYFRTARCVCRDMIRADIDKRCSWQQFEDPLLGHYNIRFPEGRFRDRLFEKWMGMKRLWFSCDLADDPDQLAAMISLRDIRRFRKSSRLGIVVNPVYVSKGYGTEIIQGLLEYYFRKMKYRTLLLDVARFNARAARCYEKCGFLKTGEFWREFEGRYLTALNPAVNKYKEHFSQRRNKLYVIHDDMKLTSGDWERHRAAEESDEIRVC